jgi:hypothetical protein
MRFLTKKLAAQIILLIFSLTVVFHLLVMIKVIPYTMVWGGRLQSDADMYRFEFVSLGLNLLFTFIVLVKSGILSIRIPIWVITSSLWVMFCLFLFNTLGNILSENHLEKIIFTPVTIVLSLLMLVLILKKN